MSERKSKKLKTWTKETACFGRLDDGFMGTPATIGGADLLDLLPSGAWKKDSRFRDHPYGCFNVTIRFTPIPASTKKKCNKKVRP